VKRFRGQELMHLDTDPDKKDDDDKKRRSKEGSLGGVWRLFFARYPGFGWWERVDGAILRS
jgi:hypothetical protein